MKKFEIFGALWALFLIIFLASFAEVGIFAVTNTLPTYEFVVGGQMVGSILLLMLMSALTILKDI
ncbi:MAG: hypothetical protein ACRECH_01980 [Nitrososphaerales archaeon]